MHRLEMLAIKSLRRDHEPFRLRGVRERTSSGEVLRRLVLEERERKKRLGTVEEKKKAVAGCNRIRALSRKGRDLVAIRNLFTMAAAGKTPMMERTLDRFANDFPATQIGPEVRAMCVKHREFSAGSSERNEIAIENASGQGSLLQFAAVTKEIPRSGVRGKSRGRRGIAHFEEILRGQAVAERVHRDETGSFSRGMFEG